MRELIKTQGYFLTPLDLPTKARQAVMARDWNELDREFRRETQPGGVVFDELSKHGEFSEIEFMISIRSSLEYPDEDGIWHDDGSRVLAFSLSLTLDPAALEGGKLEIRKRNSGGSLTEKIMTREIPTPPFGTLIVFATGHQGYEHKINRVAQGERIIIAGWCT